MALFFCLPSEAGKPVVGLNRKAIFRKEDAIVAVIPLRSGKGDSDFPPLRGSKPALELENP